MKIIDEIARIEIEGKKYLVAIIDESLHESATPTFSTITANGIFWYSKAIECGMESLWPPEEDDWNNNIKGRE